ncbi:sialate O-acetylesterase [Ilyomonas limi]|uniref:Sialate O-acetylesterase n=1 Tax=Ilyomonas limi TaxID=2575867 RepID=A0A4U3KRG4_9BACT|nr:sialate O-acetylesterase [Ilyomonas limi]TKK65005.1 sialate O-acetylesterase [Ilyomonas limi]
MKTATLYAFFLLCIIILNSCQKTMNEQQVQALAGASMDINATAKSTLKVARVFTNNMVIQRDKPASVWGTAPAGHTISVKASWKDSTFTTVTPGSGNWRVVISGAPANAMPQQLTVSDNDNSKTFSNILIGDVWVCSGQSNMVMPLDSLGPSPYYEGVLNYQAEIAAANWPNLRLIPIQEDERTSPINNIAFNTSWTVCSPATAGNYSAVAYYFGRKLMNTLNVPIGLIVAAVGNTYCEAWTNKEVIEGNTTLDAYYSGNNNSSQLYNGMINPLRNMAIKGFIWYQGENNRYDRPPSNYTKLNSALIRGWRNKFAQGSLPFYLVQMTPYDDTYFDNPSSEGGDSTADDYARFREAQSKIRNVANTGMVVTMDVGEVKRIHPKNKQPVGERLALLALQGAYGMHVNPLGPQYSSFTTNQSTATISFVSGTANGLTTINNGPMEQRFYVAGADRVFRKAVAKINGSQIILTAPAATPLPIKAIRYAFTNFPLTSIQNSDGLPMEPFRTDTWAQ